MTRNVEAMPSVVPQRSPQGVGVRVLDPRWAAPAIVGLLAAIFVVDLIRLIRDWDASRERRDAVAQAALIRALLEDR